MTCLVYFLTPLGLLGKVSGCTILPAQLSDHCPVVLQFELQNQIRGPGYWKFNVSHLNDKEFVDEINKIIDMVEFRYDNLNPINKWEMIKYDISEYTMSYSSIKAKERKQNKNRLEKRLKTLQKKLNMINLKSDNAVRDIQKTNDSIDSVLLELKKITLYQAQGAIIRSKVRWHELGEKNTKYFFGL